MTLVSTVSMNINNFQFQQLPALMSISRQSPLPAPLHPLLWPELRLADRATGCLQTDHHAKDTVGIPHEQQRWTVSAGLHRPERTEVPWRGSRGKQGIWTRGETVQVSIASPVNGHYFGSLPQRYALTFLYR